MDEANPMRKLYKELSLYNTLIRIDIKTSLRERFPHSHAWQPA